MGDSLGNGVAKAIGEEKGGRESHAGSDRPAQRRSPGFLSVSPPSFSSFLSCEISPQGLSVSSSVRASSTVRGSLHLAPGFGFQLTLPAWPSR